MVETRTCDYSGEDIEPGTGIMYVRTDGTVLHFVDSKAEKNYFLGREARDLEWTEAGRDEKAGRARAQDKAEARSETREADAPDAGSEQAATEDEATVDSVDRDAGAEQAESVDDLEDEESTEATDLEESAESDADENDEES